MSHELSRYDKMILVKSEILYYKVLVIFPRKNNKHMRIIPSSIGHIIEFNKMIKNLALR